jgi:uncharacterized membrane protein YfcA
VETYFLFFIASIVGGVINAVAGGGGLITFPVLMLVVGPMTADASSAVAGRIHLCHAGYRTQPNTCVWRALVVTSRKELATAPLSDHGKP